MNPISKLFVLRIYKDTNGYHDNSHLLWGELDRGWRMDKGYEVIVRDPAGLVCDVLIQLLNNASTNGVSAVPPKPLPVATTPPPDEKLLVLPPYFSSDATMQRNMLELWTELDRGWAIECYDEILRADADGIFYVLVKMSNAGPSGTISASAFANQACVFTTASTSVLSMGQWVKLTGAAVPDGSYIITGLTANTFTVASSTAPGPAAAGNWTAYITALPPDIPTGNITLVVTNNTTIVFTTASTTGLSVGKSISVNVPFYPAVSGTWTIASLTQTTITINAPIPNSSVAVNGSWSGVS